MAILLTALVIIGFAGIYAFIGAMVGGQWPALVLALRGDAEVVQTAVTASRALSRA